MEEKVKEPQVQEVNYGVRFPVWLGKHYVEKGSDGEEKRYVEGLAAALGKDRNVPVYELTEECLKAAVKDLHTNSVLFLEHDRSNPIGKIVDAKYIPGKGIWIKALISKTAEKVWQMITEGILTGFSIGGRVKQFVETTAKKIEDIVRRVLRIELMEVSVVALPANVNTRIWNHYVKKSFELKIGGGDKLMEEKIETTAAAEQAEEEKIEKELEDQGAEETTEEAAEETAEAPAETPAEEAPAETPAEAPAAEETVEKTEEAPAEEAPAAEKPAEEIEKSAKSIVSELESISKLKDATKMAEALRSLVSKIKDGKGNYYYQKPGKKQPPCAPAKKSVEVSTDDLKKAISEGVKEALSALPEEIRKSVSLAQTKKDEPVEDKRSTDDKLTDALKETYQK
jgi:HK97 family phage prohead protease